MELMKCPKCNKNTYVIPRGHRQNKTENNEEKKRYYCKKCKKGFSEHMYSIELKLMAIELSVIKYDGSNLPFRTVAKLLNIKSQSSILNWANTENRQELLGIIDKSIVRKKAEQLKAQFAPSQKLKKLREELCNISNRLQKDRKHSEHIADELIDAKYAQKQIIDKLNKYGDTHNANDPVYNALLWNLENSKRKIKELTATPLAETEIISLNVRKEQISEEIIELESIDKTLNAEYGNAHLIANVLDVFLEELSK